MTCQTRIASRGRLLRVLAVLMALAATALSARADAKPAPDNYRLQPMDLLKVQVFQEPDMDREVRLSKDCTVVLPLIGTVDLLGKTVRDAEALVTELYRRDYLVSPQINITVLEYTQRTLSVLGAVNNPGPVVIPPEQNLNLIEAVARAGGFSRLANRTRVTLTRALPDGRTENRVLNADQLMLNGSNGLVLQTGDVLFVPERVL